MENRWIQKQIEHVKNHLIYYYIGTLSTKSVIYLLAIGQSRPWLHHWFVTSVIVTHFNYFYLKKIATWGEKNAASYLRIYLRCLSLNWLLWSYVSLFLFPNGNTELRALIAIVYTGTVTASLQIHLLTPQILTALFYSLLLPFSIGAYYCHNSFGYLISVVSLVYLVVLNRTAHSIYHIFLNEFYLSMKNKKLLDEVESRTMNVISNAKKASLGEIAAGMAHEINNPLAFIVSTLDLMKIKKIYSQSELEQNIERIQIHIKRVTRIIRNLTYFTKYKKENSFTVENLEELVHRSLAIKRENLKQLEIDLYVKIHKNLYIECKAFDLSIALLNLVKNSQDALIDLQTKWIKIEATCDSSDTIKIRVTDSGFGVSESIREKIMVPFFTTKNPLEFTGMGLSIVLGIIKNHQGDLALDTEHSNTSFVILIPKKQKSLFTHNSHMKVS